MVVDVYLNNNFIEFAVQSFRADLNRLHKIVGPTVDPIPKIVELELAYSLTLNDQVSDESALSHVWHTFNSNHPADYKRRSVSMGDVVVLDKSRAYACALYGWSPFDWIERDRAV